MDTSSFRHVTLTPARTFRVAVLLLATAALAGCSGGGGGLNILGIGGGQADLSNVTYVRSIGAAGTPARGVLSQPSGIAFSPVNGNAFVVDQGNARVVEFTPSGAFVASFGPAGTPALQVPVADAVDSSGNVFVVDSQLKEVVEYDSMGNEQAVIGSKAFTDPLAIAITEDSQSNDTIYVADAGKSSAGGNIPYFTYAAGTFTAALTPIGSITLATTGLLASPTGVAADAAGNIYALDNTQNRIVKYTGAGTFIKSFPLTGAGTTVSASGITLDSHGYMYVADTGDNRIAVYGPTGAFQGVFGTSGSGKLQSPMGVAFDAFHTVYVADSGNGRIALYSSLIP